MKRGTKPVAEYVCTFKTIYDQLHAIDRPVEDIDKVHWFLHGLDTNFLTSSIPQMALASFPYFSFPYFEDLISKTENFELF